MKKFLLSFGLIFVFTAYILYQRQGDSSAIVAVNKQNNLAPAETPAQVPVSTPVATPKTTLKSVIQSNPISNFFNSFSDDEVGGDDRPRTVRRTTTTTTTTKPKTTTTTTTPKPVTTPTSTPVPTPAPVAQGQYKNGTYTGSNEFAYSDYIQVSAVIQGGKLVDVTFPSTASGPSRSRQIYSYSMPQLRSEAISAQSANINGVSGASYTSQAFQNSLATALANAVN